MSAASAGDGLVGRFFAGAREDTLAALRRSGRPQRFEAGAPLFHEGDPASRFIVLRQGQVRIWRSAADGAAVTVHLLGPGDVPGCVAVFRGIPYPASAMALDEVSALSWQVADVMALLDRDPALAANALAIMGGRNADMLERLMEVSTLPVAQRVARALLRLDGTSPGGAGTPVRTTRQALAELAATTLHTVSRLVSRWEAAGIVTAGRGHILVRDRPGLERQAGAC